MNRARGGHLSPTSCSSLTSICFAGPKLTFKCSGSSRLNIYQIYLAQPYVNWFCSLYQIHLDRIVAYLDLRRNNLLLNFRLVVPFVSHFVVSFNLAFFEFGLFGFCTASSFSSRLECFFVPVRFCRKHNITLRVIAQWRRTRIGRHIRRPRLRCHRGRRFLIHLVYHTLNDWMHFTNVCLPIYWAQVSCTCRG